MKRRMSSFDTNYFPGALSVFPTSRDSAATLYEVSNEARTVLKHTLTPSSRYITVEDATRFPYSGILRIVRPNNKSNEAEIIYYGAKVANQFHYLQRGFAGHNTYTWSPGSEITLPVMAEHHNALKDAILNIQKKLGLMNNPSEDSIQGSLKTLENKWLNSKASFRAWPRNGTGPLLVKFQNTSIGNIKRFLWDFGDGTTSTEKNPQHLYKTEGNYTVKLNVASDTDAQGIAEKTDYINVNNNKVVPFFYVDYIGPNEFEFVDQTYGNIIERHWIFGDGKESIIKSPNIHSIRYKYNDKGSYVVNLVLRLDNNKTIRTSSNVVVE